MLFDKILQEVHEYKKKLFKIILISSFILLLMHFNAFAFN